MVYFSNIGKKSCEDTSSLPDSAVQDFQVLYKRHYGVQLSYDEAEALLMHFLSMLRAAREGANAPARGHDEYYRDQFIP